MRDGFDTAAVATHPSGRFGVDRPGRGGDELQVCFDLTWRERAGHEPHRQRRTDLDHQAPTRPLIRSASRLCASAMAGPPVAARGKQTGL